MCSFRWRVSFKPVRRRASGLREHCAPLIVQLRLSKTWAQEHDGDQGMLGAFVPHALDVASPYQADVPNPAQRG